jgi:RNA polymerase nonessential primary-like sigma factor
MNNRHEPNGPPRGLDPVDRYLSEIAGVRLLDAASEARLAREIERHGRVELLLALRIPCVARSVLEHWRQRRSHPERVALAPVMERVTVLLKRHRALQRPGVVGARGRRRRTEAQIAHLLVSTGYSKGVREGCLALQKHLDWLERNGGGRRERERAAAAPVTDLQERMRRIELHRAVRDRAVQRFVEHNLRLAVAIAKLYRNTGVPFADLIQEANLGLIRAVGQFDVERGVRFSTYAKWPIYEGCIRAVQNHSRTVRLPSHVHEQLRALARATRWLEQRGRTATRREIVDLLRVEGSGLERLLGARARALSLENPVSNGRGPAQEIGDRLADPQSRDPAAWIDESRLLGELRFWLNTLDARERQVVDQRFGLHGEEPRTLREVGRSLDLSHESVRQIEARALHNLRQTATLRGFRYEGISLAS